MISQKKLELAKSLYLSGFNNKQIAEKVAVNEKTIARWIKKHKWDIIKAANNSTKPDVIAGLYLNIAEIQECARNDNRPISNAESDQIIKISNAISKLEDKLSLQTYIEVFKEFNDFLSKNNSKLLKPNNIAQDEFIQKKVNEHK